METVDNLKEEVSKKEIQTYKWLIGVLISIVGFFLVMTYAKVDTIDKNVQSIITNDAVQSQQILSNEHRITALEEMVREIQRSHK